MQSSRRIKFGTQIYTAPPPVASQKILILIEMLYAHLLKATVRRLRQDAGIYVVSPAFTWPILIGRGTDIFRHIAIEQTYGKLRLQPHCTRFAVFQQRRVINLSLIGVMVETYVKIRKLATVDKGGERRRQVQSVSLALTEDNGVELSRLDGIARGAVGSSTLSLLYKFVYTLSG